MAIAKMTVSLRLKAILALTPSKRFLGNSDSRNSSYAQKSIFFMEKDPPRLKNPISGLHRADLNGSSDSIADLKPKGLGFESQIRQGYICWWCGSKRSGCVINVSPCGFKVKGFALIFPKRT
jgi:hypothetical protein